WTGQADFAQNIDFFQRAAGEVKVILRLEDDVLRKIALLEEALQINRLALALSHQEAALQVHEIDAVLIVENARLEALRARHRFHNRYRTIEREDAAIGDFAEDVIFFAVVGHRRDGDARAAIIFAQLFLQLRAQLIDREAGGDDV